MNEKEPLLFEPYCLSINYSDSERASEARDKKAVFSSRVHLLRSLGHNIQGNTEPVIISMTHKRSIYLEKVFFEANSRRIQRIERQIGRSVGQPK